MSDMMTSGAMRAETYKHSGKVSVGGMVLAAAILIPAAILLGAIYSALVVYVPFVKLRGLITLLYGGALGALAGAVFRMAKFRSPLFVALGTLAFTAVSYYVCWAVHAGFVILRFDGFSEDVPVAFLNGFLPQNVLGWAQYIYDEGLWGMGGGNPLKGTGVLILWAVEALVIFGTAFVAKATYGNSPFCEDCNQWTEETKELAQLPVSAEDPAWQQFAAGDLDAVKRLQVVQDAPQYVELQMATCSSCERSDFVSAVGVTLTANNEGEIQKHESDIVRHLKITRSQANEIQEFAVAMAQAYEELSGEDPDDVQPIEGADDDGSDPYRPPGEDTA